MSGFFKYQQPLMYGLPTYKIFPTRAWRTFETYTDDLIKHGQKFVVKVITKEVKLFLTSSVITNSLCVREKNTFVLFMLIALLLRLNEIR